MSTKWFGLFPLPTAIDLVNWEFLNIKPTTILEMEPKGPISTRDAQTCFNQVTT